MARAFPLPYQDTRARAGIHQERTVMHVDRREFLGWSTLAAAGLCADGLFVPAWAQDVRGLPFTPAVRSRRNSLSA